MAFFVFVFLFFCFPSTTHLGFAVSLDLFSYRPCRLQTAILQQHRY